MPNSERQPISNLCTRMNFESPRKPIATIGMVEDMEDTIVPASYFFINRGYRFVGFLINNQQYPTDMQQKELADQIAQSGLDLAVVDAGLGYVNGIRLSRRLKEADIPVIMLSGGVHTSETNGAIDRFLLKPFPVDELVQVASELLGIK